MLKPLTLGKFFISLIAVSFTVACGRNFKTLDVETQKILEAPPAETVSSKDEKPESADLKPDQAVATSELWVSEIPNKYDDVGSFFRVKEIPGLQSEQILDSVEVGENKNGKNLQLVRGKLKLSRVSHHFDSVNNQLEVNGDVSFSDGRAIPFKLTGKLNNGEIALKVVDQTSSLSPVFRAKAMCSSGVIVEGIEPSESSPEFCRRVIIDFYYRDKDKFYTDQLITKEILFDEITKNTRPSVPAGDPIIDEESGDELSDYEKSQKQGTLELPTETNSESELPYYFAEPSIDDVAVLYPDVSKEIETKKQSFFRNKKKIKAVPKLTGEERIPEKDTDARTNPAESAKPDPKPVETPVKPVEPAPGKPSVPSIPIPTPAPPVAPPVKPVIPSVPVAPPQQNPSPVKPAPPAPVPPTPPAPKPPVTPPVTNPPSNRPPTPPTGVKPQPPTKPPEPVKPTPVRPPSQTPQPAVDPDRPRDQAIGKAMNGRMVNSNSLLEAAQKLGTNAGFEILWPTKKRHYATYDMVDLVVNLGEWLLKNLNDVPLSIGDVSAKNGGALGQYVNVNGRQVWTGHASHRTGMDIDIAYLTRVRSKVMNRVDLPDKGGYTHSAFLAADQWRLMKIAHEVAPVEVIYVNRNIKNEMCKQALKAGDLKSPTDTTSPAAAILTKMVVQDQAHGNHWHVRLDCQMLKTMKFQTKCLPHPQLYVGPECKNVKL